MVNAFSLWLMKRETKRNNQRERELAEQEEQRQLEEEISRVHAAWKSIIVFPGTKEQFEQKEGYAVEVMDLRKIYSNRRDLGLTYSKSSRTYSENFEGRKCLLDEGLVAIIHAVPESMHGGDDSARYGLPVRKKEETKS
ncbi:MAG: hypothetical protein V1725_07645 [archaeon]